MHFFVWGGGGVNKVHYGLCENDESCEHLSDMWLSTLEIGAARLNVVTKIAPKSPFLCVNGCPVRCGIRANTKLAIRYGLNIASNGSCKGSFVTRGSSSIVREIEDYLLLFSYIRSASQDVVQPTWWTLTRKFLMLPIILIVIAYNRANLYINCWGWYHHALMLVWLFNKHEASAILLLICSLEVWVKVTYDWSTALCLCLCLCRPSFH